MSGGGMWGWAALAACVDGVRTVPDDEACEQAAYAMAANALRCGAEPAEANARYDDFHDAWTCIATRVRADDFGCAEGMLALPCGDGDAQPVDADAWLQSDASCFAILEPADGREVPLPDVPSHNPVCAPLFRPLLDRSQQCTYANNQTYPYYGSYDDPEQGKEMLRRDLGRVQREVDEGFRCLATDLEQSPDACIEALSCGAPGTHDVTPSLVLLATEACGELFAPKELR